MKKFIKFILGAVIVAGILIIGGVALLSAGANQAVKSVDHAVKQEQQHTQTKDELLQAMLSKAPAPVVHKDEYSYYVEYTLTNNTKDDFSYIQLNADVFDKNGVKLGNDMTNITDVKAGQTFKIRIDLYQDGATSYKITGISSQPH